MRVRCALFTVPDVERTGSRPHPRPRKRRRIPRRLPHVKAARRCRRKRQRHLAALDRLRLAARRRRRHNAAQGVLARLQVGERQMGALARLAGQVRPRAGQLNLPLVRQRLALSDSGSLGEEVVDQRAVARHRIHALGSNDHAAKHAVRRRRGERRAIDPRGRHAVGRHRAHAPLVLRVGSKVGSGAGRCRKLRHRDPCVRASRPVQQREGAAVRQRAAPCERRRRVADILHFQAGRNTGRLHAHRCLVAGHRGGTVGRVRHLAAHVTARLDGKRHATARFVHDLRPRMGIVEIGIERPLLPHICKLALAYHTVEVRSGLHRSRRIRLHRLVARVHQHRFKLQGRMLRGRDEQVRERRKRLHAVLHGLHTPLVDRLGLQAFKHQLASIARNRSGRQLPRTAFAIKNLELVGLRQAALFPRPGKLSPVRRDARCRQAGRRGGRERAGDLAAIHIVSVTHAHLTTIPTRSGRSRVVRYDAQRFACRVRHRYPTRALLALPLVLLLAAVVRYDGIGHGRELEGAAVADNRRRPHRRGGDLRRGEPRTVHPLRMGTALPTFYIIIQHGTHAPFVSCIRLQIIGKQGVGTVPPMVSGLPRHLHPLACANLTIAQVKAEHRIGRFTRVVAFPTKRDAGVVAKIAVYRCGKIVRQLRLNAHARRIAVHRVAGHAVDGLRHLAAHVAVRVDRKRYRVRCFVRDCRPSCLFIARIDREFALLPRVREGARIHLAVHVRGRLERDRLGRACQIVGRRHLHPIEVIALFQRGVERFDLRPRRCHAVLHGPHAPLIGEILVIQRGHHVRHALVVVERYRFPLHRSTVSCNLSIVQLELHLVLLTDGTVPRPVERGLNIRMIRIIRVKSMDIGDGKISRRGGHHRYDGLVAVERLRLDAARGRDLAAIGMRANRQALRGNLQRIIRRTVHRHPIGAIKALPLVGQLLVVAIGIGFRRELDGAIGVNHDALRARRDLDPREHDLFRQGGERRTCHPVAAQLFGAVAVGDGAHGPLVHRARLQVGQLEGVPRIYPCADPLARADGAIREVECNATRALSPADGSGRLIHVADRQAARCCRHDAHARFIGADHRRVGQRLRKHAGRRRIRHRAAHIADRALTKLYHARRLAFERRPCIGIIGIRTQIPLLPLVGHGRACTQHVVHVRVRRELRLLGRAGRLVHRTHHHTRELRDRRQRLRHEQRRGRACRRLAVVHHLHVPLVGGGGHEAVQRILRFRQVGRASPFGDSRCAPEHAVGQPVDKGALPRQIRCGRRYVLSQQRGRGLRRRSEADRLAGYGFQRIAALAGRHDAAVQARARFRIHRRRVVRGELRSRAREFFDILPLITGRALLPQIRQRLVGFHAVQVRHRRVHDVSGGTRHSLAPARRHRHRGQRAGLFERGERIGLSPLGLQLIAHHGLDAPGIHRVRLQALHVARRAGSHVVHSYPVVLARLRAFRILHLVRDGTHVVARPAQMHRDDVRLGRKLHGLRHGNTRQQQAGGAGHALLVDAHYLAVFADRRSRGCHDAAIAVNRPALGRRDGKFLLRTVFAFHVDPRLAERVALPTVLQLLRQHAVHVRCHLERHRFAGFHQLLVRGHRGRLEPARKRRGEGRSYLAARSNEPSLRRGVYQDRILRVGLQPIKLTCAFRGVVGNGDNHGALGFYNVFPIELHTRIPHHETTHFAVCLPGNLTRGGAGRPRLQIRRLNGSHG